MSGEGATDSLLRRALAEDVGAGDWTTLWTVPEAAQGDAVIVAKAPGVIAGSGVAAAVFRSVDADLDTRVVVCDGAAVEPGDLVMRVSGRTRSILTAERVALNFLRHLSGIATLTRAFADAVAGTGARILDTRKTAPGLRQLEKAAVVAGGGTNHRFGLHDMLLLKENHIAAAGGIEAALEAVRKRNARGLPVEVETRSLDEVDQALRRGADRILFDNMPLEMLRAAVQRVQNAGAPRPQTEASGGVTLDSVRAIAETGVDFISVGALTHSAPALDMSLLLEGGDGR